MKKKSAIPIMKKKSAKPIMKKKVQYQYCRKICNTNNEKREQEEKRIIKSEKHLKERSAYL